MSPRQDGFFKSLLDCALAIAIAPVAFAFDRTPSNTHTLLTTIHWLF